MLLPCEDYCEHQIKCTSNEDTDLRKMGMSKDCGRILQKNDG